MNSPLSKPDSEYDRHGDFYYDFIKKGLAEEDSIFNLTVAVILDMLGNVKGKKICDLACGEGHLSRRLAGFGASVTGVDLSENLLNHAQEESVDHSINFILDDAQELAELDEESFDAVICNMALMDIADLSRTLQAVKKVLVSQGQFIFSVLHPCFESPFSVTDGELLELDENGNFAASRVFEYAKEGKWYSGGTGMRGTFGSIHRKVSTYINSLIETGFELKRVEEPTLPDSEHEDPVKQWSRVIPRTIVIQSIRKS